MDKSFNQVIKIEMKHELSMKVYEKKVVPRVKHVFN